MSAVARRLAELGLVLPPASVPPAGIRFPFQPVRLLPGRALVAGHGPQGADGEDVGPFGRVGAEVTEEQGYRAARLTALSMLGSLHRALGDLDRIVAWGRVFGMVNVAPGFTRMPAVINGCSDLLLEVFGPEVGAHARSAVGMAALPFDIPVEIEAEVLVRD